MINTIFMDLGDTFRIIRKDEKYQYEAKKTITDLLGTDEDPLEFYKRVIEPRYDVYREWVLKFFVLSFSSLMNSTFMPTPAALAPVMSRPRLSAIDTHSPGSSPSSRLAMR